MKTNHILPFTLAAAIVCLVLADLLDNKVKPRDYQIEVKQTGSILYDGDRVVGTFKLSGSLDSLIIKDNQ